MQMIQNLRLLIDSVSETVAISVTWCYFRWYMHQRSVSLSFLNTRTDTSVLFDPSLPIGENCQQNNHPDHTFLCRNQRSLVETALKTTWSVSPCSSLQQLSLSCGKVHSFTPTLPHTIYPSLFRFVEGSEEMNLDSVWVAQFIFLCVRWHLCVIVFYKVTSTKR